MIKDRLTEAIEANYDKIQKGDDHIPIGMRGELEVIVKDRDGNVLSYERDHNQVTKLAKMALLHLLAGEIGTVDSGVYSIPESSDAANKYMRAYALEDVGDLPAHNAEIFSTFVPANHDFDKNLDGQLVSNSQYFYKGSNYMDQTNTHLSQVYPKDNWNAAPLKFNFPTKMLFGTGLEAYDKNETLNIYASDFGAPLGVGAVLTLNGYSSNYSGSIGDYFYYGCSTDEIQNYPSIEKRLTNWYSADAHRCRTLQPASANTPLTASPTANDTAIKGAIKNCFIETTSDTSLYNVTTKMAMAPYRGFGYPCFIYATRETDSFYVNNEGNRDVYYGLNSALGAQAYETEVTYTVVMPAQPVASNSISTFYPYNGWVLRQAGLFCDSRYKIRSVPDNDSSLGELHFLDDVNNNESLSNTSHTWRDSVGGQMLFTRNLSSPILKTADEEVTFIWHIFITV